LKERDMVRPKRDKPRGVLNVRGSETYEGLRRYWPSGRKAWGQDREARRRQGEGLTGAASTSVVRGRGQLLSQECESLIDDRVLSVRQVLPSESGRDVRLKAVAHERTPVRRE